MNGLKRSFIASMALATALICALPARAATFFVEAETFKVTGDGWHPVSVEEQGGLNAEVTEKVRRAKVLGDWGGDGDSIATTTVTIPAAGDYRLYIRYRQNPDRGPFHVGALQNGKESAGKDFDLVADKEVALWSYLCGSLDVHLAAGKCVIQLSRYKNKDYIGNARYVDCVLLTDDKTLKPDDYIPYGPQIYMRVTFGDCYEKKVYIHIAADHYSDPWLTHYAISKDGLGTGVNPPYGYGLYPKTGAPAFYASNESTGWVNITQMAHQDSGASLIICARFNYQNSPTLGIAPRFKAKFELAPEPDDQKIVKTFERDAAPAVVVLVVPPDLTPENLSKLEMDLDIAEATGKIADAMKWPTFGQKPSLYPFLVAANPDSDFYLVDKKVSDREWKTLDYFGFSNREKEIIYGSWASYDNYCQPDTKKMEAAIKSSAEAFKKAGKKVDSIVYCDLMDEPQGRPLSETAHSPACAEQFREWMKELKKTPQDLGVASWDEVKPVEEAQSKSQPELYYYSQKFRTRTLSKYLRIQRELVLSAYGGTFPVNEAFSDGSTYCANFTAQGVDYFQLLEDTDDQNAIGGGGWGNGAASRQCTTFDVELIRSAAMKRSQHIGHYLVSYAWRLPWDDKLNVVSQVARDVKAFYNFWYGPSWAGHEGGPPWNCSSTYARPETWFSIAEIGREIGGAEDLLFTAKKKKAEVAILYSTASDIWCSYSYGFDRMYAWLALTHGNIPVDFVSEKTVAETGLSGYKACYFAGRNLCRASAEQLASWVKAGGTLVMTAGAGARDEFNRPMATLNDILPASYGKLDEFQPHRYAGEALLYLAPKENVTLAKGGAKFEVLSVKQELLPKPQSQILGRFADGLPAIVMRESGTGVVYSFGFLPGLSYMHPALAARKALSGNVSKSGAKETEVPDPLLILSDTDLLRRSWCPWQYPAEIRNAIVAPALQANADRPVLCSVPLVDAVCMETEKGQVVALANYTLQPIQELTLGVESKKSIQRVESVHHGKLQFKQEAGRVNFSLPLVETDFVELYY